MSSKDKNTTRRSIPWIAAGAAAGAVLLAVSVQAQELGRLATFGLSFGGSFTANDPDPDEDELFSRLSFDLRSETRSQSFRLSADGRPAIDDGEFDVDNRGISLDYTRRSRAAELSFGASYREQDADGEFAIFDPITLDRVDLIEDDGTRESLSVNAGLRTGIDAPFGTNTQLSYTGRRFTDTADPDLTDLDTWEISTVLRFEVDPRITLRTSASYRESDEEDLENTRRRTTRLGIGADLALDRLWSAAVDLSYSNIETERDIIGITEQEGGGFSIGLTRQMRAGTLGFSLARDITENGAEDSFRVRRNTELSNGGTLAWSLGLVSFDNGDTAPIASIAYARPTPRGNFSVDLQQTTSVDTDDRNTVRTVLGVDYSEEINAVSSWSLNGSLASVDVVGLDAEDQLRTEVGVGYTRALTRDWDLSTRLRHRVIYEGGDRDNSASILSFSLERSFSFRP